nr:unnamed protein product [Callosobruchus analis]
MTLVKHKGPQNFHLIGIGNCNHSEKRDCLH